MINRLSLLWVVTCVVLSHPVEASAPMLDVSTKQTSSSIKKIESLTVQRLPKTAVRIQEQSTLENRRDIAIKAERIFRKAGITSDKMIIAMLANAWHESRWNPRAQGGSCIGFFQLHTRWMGRGSSVEQLKDLTHNVHKLMATTSFKDWVKWCNANPNKTAGQMSYRFASHVERCAKQHRAPREHTANRWYKSLKAA